MAGENYTSAKRWQHGATRETDPEAWARHRASAGSNLTGSTTAQEEQKLAALYQGRSCARCGAWQGSYGLEPTPWMWVEHTILWLRDVKRVLRKDGTCWLNVGSSYAGSGQGWGKSAKQASNREARPWLTEYGYGRPPGYIGSPASGNGFKPQDLVWLAALLYPALLAEGWIVRSVIIWHKANPMPESVAGWLWSRHRIKQGQRSPGLSDYKGRIPDTMGARHGGDMAQQLEGTPALSNWADCPGCSKCEPNDGLVLRKGSWRPTSSYEEFLMLAKGTDYFADGEAVREPQSALTFRRFPDNIRFKSAEALDNAERYREASGRGRGWPIATLNPILPSGRNLRDVWEFPTHAYTGAHFATFPEELVNKCILASTAEYGVCAECGAPWARVLEHGELTQHPQRQGRTGPPPGDYDVYLGHYGQAGTLGMVQPKTTVGWRKTCRCETDERQPATVLDPFIGSGTTALVARKLGRHWIGIDLSKDYIMMAKERIDAISLAMPLYERGDTP